MVEERLLAAGLACEICDTLDVLIAVLKHDAGVALIAQEALEPSQTDQLLAVLDGQEPWSDVPVLLLSFARAWRMEQLQPSGGFLRRANVMLLQRPMTVELFLSAVRSAVRARRRQYQMRDLYRELMRAVQLSELFVGILGHDLRTPLGAIKMSAEFIVRDSDDARSSRPAGRILSSADRMTRMIDQLLDFVRLRQGRGIGLKIVSADIGDIAGQVLQEVSDANPQVRLDVSRRGNLSGCWDSDRLAQVVSNLVGNAVQHGVSTQPIAVEMDGTAPDTVFFRVHNLGAISVDAQSTLFEPFQRATSSKSARKGLGLGLFIAREILRAHGGEIALRVADGRTVFEARLPRVARPVETEVLALP
jgi:signal transduction histidine kinase